jgi:hypothetical protein
MKSYEFTKDIPEEDKPNGFTEPKNWNEVEAKKENKLACHDCRWFSTGFSHCSTNIGVYHKTCNEFDWW